MDWLKIISTFWPIVATLLSAVCLAVVLWLKTQFPTKADFLAHQKRLEAGSEKLANLDKRVAVVEEDCERTPSKHDLSQGLAVVAGRVSGLESSVRGVETQVKTQNGYLQTLIEQGLRGK